MFKTIKLMPHQEKELSFCLTNRKSLNFSEPSTGKTVQAALFAYYLSRFENAKTLLINGSKSIMIKNRDEILKFSEFKPEEVVVVDTTPERRLGLFSNPNTKVFLMTAECLSNNLKEISKIEGIDSIIVDESHKVYGSVEAKRTLNLLKCKPKNFLALTGSPIVGGRLDSVYPLVKICRPLAYSSIEHFHFIHKDLDPFTGKVTWKNHQLLIDILKPISIRHTVAEVYPNASGTIIQKHKVEMGKDMKEAYKEWAEKAVLELEDMFLRAANEGIALLRARQILGCPEVFDLNFEKTKDEALIDYLEEEGQRIVFASYIPEQERIVKLAKELGLRVALINSSVSGDKRGQIDKDFREGTIDVIVASPQAAEVGFNWQNTKNIIFYSLPYNDDSFLQAIKRGNRGSRKEPLIVKVLEYKDSVESKVWEILKRKSKENNKIMKDSPLIKEGELGC